MKKRKRIAENIKDVRTSKEYSIEELIELGEKNNRIDLAKPLFKTKKTWESAKLEHEI